jgi:hypothetical protein
MSSSKSILDGVFKAIYISHLFSDLNNQVPWCPYDGHQPLWPARNLVILKKKEYEGLGIPNLREMNMSWLASWIRRCNLDDNKTWKQIIDSKLLYYDPNSFTKGRLISDERSEARRW